MSRSRVALDDGAYTTVERWGERGPVVLAVHGMTSSRLSWERLARHLDGRFRVFAYDQRGHGDSAEITGPMSLERGVRDFRNVAESIGEPIDLAIGHSWGGAVAVMAGLRTPVSRVAAIDPMLHQVAAQWYGEYVAELAEQFANAGQARDAIVREEYAQWHPLDVEAKVHAVHAMTVAPIEGLLSENPRANWDLLPSIERYDKPLLLAMAAEGESINDDAALLALRTRIPPLVEVVTFPGAGHNLHRTQFDAFAEVLDRFLNR
ncbi:MAG TPA: alpha/beta hydrolase [Candidatus Acidoferrales bacterium]|nr:alpha/beta hydrolase [Candidatus Acidoferrales bacterium]